MVDHLQSRVTPWRQYTSHVKVRGTLSKMDVPAMKSHKVTQTATRPKRNSDDVLSHAPNISHKPQEPKTITHNDEKIALVLALAGGFAILNMFR